jgi:DNA-binding winged helix-turn-helix (wHTH) protein
LANSDVFDPTEHSYYLRSWQVLPERNLIRNGDRVQRLEPKVMAVLACLAGQAGDTVSREQIMLRVWEGNHVSEKVLSRAISHLRKAFDDSPGQASFIETTVIA